LLQTCEEGVETDNVDDGLVLQGDDGADGGEGHGGAMEREVRGATSSSFNESEL